MSDNSDLPLQPVGTDIWYAIHYKGSRSQFQFKRVIDREAFLQNLRDDHGERGGVVEEFFDAIAFEEARTAAK